MLVEVHDLAAMMQQDHEHIEHAKGRGRYDEEVDRDEIVEVVLEERATKSERVASIDAA